MPLPRHVRVQGEVIVDELEQLKSHVRASIGSRVQWATPRRVDELTGLVVRYWPHHHLAAAGSAGGRNHKAVAHAMRLVRAQVREQYEARHGAGPLWSMVLGGTVASVSHVLLDLWFEDDGWRERLKHLGGRA
jgi:hypothetical protein